jgi:hypothetical protein
MVELKSIFRYVSLCNVIFQDDGYKKVTILVTVGALPGAPEKVVFPTTWASASYPGSHEGSGDEKTISGQEEPMPSVLFPKILDKCFHIDTRCFVNSVNNIICGFVRNVRIPFLKYMFRKFILKNLSNYRFCIVNVLNHLRINKASCNNCTFSHTVFSFLEFTNWEPIRKLGIRQQIFFSIPVQSSPMLLDN